MLRRLLAVATVVAAFTAPALAGADPFDLTPLELQVARVAWNEAQGSVPDVRLIWQVTEARARTTAGRLEWLRRHSPRVAGRRPCRRGPCLWSPLLKPGPHLPAAFPGWLPELHRGDWTATQRAAVALVRGVDRRRPCSGPIPPITWGGPMDLAAALERGLVPLGCRGTRNDGFRRAAPARSAPSDADRDPRRYPWTPEPDPA